MSKLTVKLYELLTSYIQNPDLDRIVHEIETAAYVTTRTLEPVDLRTCKPGDILISSLGKVLEYVGPTEEDHYYDHYVKYPEEKTLGTRTHDGFVFRKNRHPGDHNIIAIIPQDSINRGLEKISGILDAMNKKLDDAKETTA